MPATPKTRSLGSFRCVLVGSPAYLAQRGRPRRLGDLRKHDLLQLRLPNSGRLQPLRYVRTHSKKAEFASMPVVANKIEALVDFAVRGRGLAYVAEALVRDERARGALVPVLEEHVGHWTPAHMVWAPCQQMPSKLRSFIDWMAERLRPLAA